MDLSNILIGDTTWSFVLEILVRCTIMFIIIISFLRLSGKRGIRQLSLFELAMALLHKGLKDRAPLEDPNLSYNSGLR
ncbi:hypothetical protein ACJOG9_15275, partial [Acinetobacter baumannii]